MLQEHLITGLVGVLNTDTGITQFHCKLVIMSLNTYVFDIQVNGTTIFGVTQ